MLLKRGGKDMKKQINLKIIDSNVIAYMNEIELFRISNEAKTINIDELYKKMTISKNDTLENMMEEIKSPNKRSLEILYDYVKAFLDELINKINEALTLFDLKKEEELLINQ